MLIPLSSQLHRDRLEAWLGANGLTADDLALDRPQARMRQIGEAMAVETVDILPAFRSTLKEGGGRSLSRA